MTIPALLTRMSMRSSVLATASTVAVTDSGSVTSQRNPRLSSPRATAASSAPDSLRSTTAMRAPLAAKAAAMAAPMPDAPPVTRATLPSSLKFRSIVGSDISVPSCLFAGYGR
jgi:hypothetical protein